MHSIGDFARIAGVTTRTLRHYDDVGLLVPARTDGRTGYRSYSATQLPRLARITALRELGLTLEQIATVLADGISAVELRGMLRLRRAQLDGELDALRAQAATIESALRIIDREEELSTMDIVIKQVPEIRAASMAAPSPGFGIATMTPVLRPLFGSLVHELEVQGVRPAGPLFVFSTGDPEEQTLVAHVSVDIADAEVEERNGLRIVVLPPAEVLSVVRTLADPDTGVYYAALFARAEALGRQPLGHGRDILRNLTAEDPNDRIMEHQLPVA